MNTTIWNLKNSPNPELFSVSEKSGERYLISMQRSEGVFLLNISFKFSILKIC